MEGAPARGHRPARVRVRVGGAAALVGCARRVGVQGGKGEVSARCRAGSKESTSQKRKQEGRKREAHLDAGRRLPVASLRWRCRAAAACRPARRGGMTAVDMLLCPAPGALLAPAQPRTDRRSVPLAPAMRRVPPRLPPARAAARGTGRTCPRPARAPAGTAPAPAAPAPAAPPAAPPGRRPPGPEPGHRRLRIRVPSQPPSAPRWTQRGCAARARAPPARRRRRGAAAASATRGTAPVE